MSYASALRRLEQKLDKRVALKAQELRSIIVETLSEAGTGRVYGNHQASAPGQPPAVDTGTYRQSWQVRKRAVGVYAVSTNQARGPALEFGSRTIAPRPHLRPSVEKLKANS